LFGIHVFRLDRLNTILLFGIHVFRLDRLNTILLFGIHVLRLDRLNTILLFSIHVFTLDRLNTIGGPCLLTKLNSNRWLHIYDFSLVSNSNSGKILYCCFKVKTRWSFSTNENWLFIDRDNCWGVFESLSSHLFVRQVKIMDADLQSHIRNEISSALVTSQNNMMSEIKNLLSSEMGKISKQQKEIADSQMIKIKSTFTDDY